MSTALEELSRQFPSASLVIREDGQGGAYVIIEPMQLGSKYRPTETWVGFHIPAQYPYADIYPVFIGADIVRVDGVAFAVPITTGFHFEGREALQVSRRNTAAQDGSQRAAARILKILDFLERLAS